MGDARTHAARAHGPQGAACDGMQRLHPEVQQQGPAGAAWMGMGTGSRVLGFQIFLQGF